MKTNTTIYTEEFVLKELKKLLEELQNNKNFVYLGQLFIKKRYSRQRYSEWIKKYWHNEEIVEISDTIKNILETRINVWGLVNQLNASLVKFNLINNFDWKDKQEIDQTTNMHFHKNLENVSDEELNDIIKNN